MWVSGPTCSYASSLQLSRAYTSASRSTFILRCAFPVLRGWVPCSAALPYPHGPPTHSVPPRLAPSAPPLPPPVPPQIRMTHSLRAHWDTALPGRVLTLHYEEVRLVVGAGVDRGCMGAWGLRGMYGRSESSLGMHFAMLHQARDVAASKVGKGSHGEVWSGVGRRAGLHNGMVPQVAVRHVCALRYMEVENGQRGQGASKLVRNVNLIPYVYPCVRRCSPHTHMFPRTSPHPHPHPCPCPCPCPPACVLPRVNGAPPGCPLRAVVAPGAAAAPQDQQDGGHCQRGAGGRMWGTRKAREAV